MFQTSWIPLTDILTQNFSLLTWPEISADWMESDFVPHVWKQAHSSPLIWAARS